jgi:hypothetical protein
LTISTRIFVYLAAANTMYSTAEIRRQFSNEEALIILLSRLYLRTTSREEVDEFIQTAIIDYTRVYKIASVHSIRPLLFHVISSNDLKVDQGFFGQLKAFYLQNQFRSMEQLTICHSIITGLNIKRISAIPFKGTSFAYSYYGNMGLRESTDIDLLVHPDDVAAVEDHFKEKGLLPKVAVPSSYLNYYKKYFKEIVYSVPAKTNKAYSVEIHWKALNYYFGSYPGFNFFKEGVMEIHTGALKLPVLKPTYDFLAVASNYFVKDMAVKFKYLIDIACVINKNQQSLNTGLINTIIDQHHCRRKVEYGLQLVEDLLGKSMLNVNRHYRFKHIPIASTLQVPLAVRDFNVTNLRFLRKAIELQDNVFQKIKFIGRCAFYFLLPTDNDLNSAKSRKAPIVILALLRPLRLSLKAFSQVLKRK